MLGPSCMEIPYKRRHMMMTVRGNVPGYLEHRKDSASTRLEIKITRTNLGKNHVLIPAVPLHGGNRNPSTSITISKPWTVFSPNPR